MTRRNAKPRRRPSAHARRPGIALRRRVDNAMPRPGRIAAGLLTAVLIGGLLALVHGPWLRVATIAWAGERYTEASQLQHALAALDGTPLLMVDAAGLAAKLERLPAIEHARVEAFLPDAVKVTIEEKKAAFIWQTSAVRLLGDADGTLIGQVALQADLAPDLAALPLVDDRRNASRGIIVGDQIEAPTLAAALRLAAIDPRAMGSTATHLDLRLTDVDGFLLVSSAPPWQADFGFYPAQDSGELATIEQRVNGQVAAVRTLFSLQGEGQVSWVDARDPGRVYWRP
ncbi:MAG: FtsQ-type POTRA domain-containing protein [Chloroflexota bacterium]|nr:FtsQ-type POTRA domain-containing protein [Chloroflexota bacterium]